MYTKLSNEFNEFEIIANEFAESFFKENIDLIELKTGCNRINLNLKKLTQLYVLYEFVKSKVDARSPITEMSLLNALRVGKRNEYIKVLRDYSNECGKICSSSFSSYDLVCDMAKLSRKEIKEKGIKVSTENLIVLEGYNKYV